MAYRKYNATKTIVDGIKFDSKKEAKRYLQLKELEKNGDIKNLKRQVKFELIPAQREPDTVGKRGGKIKGKLIEKAWTYRADFTYTDVKTGEYVVEDVKGFKTSEYKAKRKAMLYFHGIKIKEV